MAEDKDPFAEFGGSKIVDDKDPFAEFGGSKLRGKPIQPVAPTGSKPSKTGFEPFQAQVPTKTPSVLTEKGATEYKEQVKNYKPPVQKQPDLPKAEKPLSNLESIKNTVYNVANSLKGVLPRLSLTSVDVFEKVLGKDLTGKLTSLPRIEFSSDGFDIVTGRTPEQIRNESLQSLDYLGTQTKPTAGIVENARNFNIPGLAAGVVDAAGGLVSTIIPSALSGGSLLVTEMVGGGLYDYNTAKAKAKGVSTEDLYKSGDADFGVPAAIGGVAYSMEKIGLKGFTKAISKKLTGSGFKKALLLGTEWNKEGLTEWVQVGLDEANVALANGLSAEDAALAAADKMTSVEGLEAYAKGIAGSAAASWGVRLAKRLINPKNKAKGSELEQQKIQAMQDLANDNIEPNAKEAILEALENTTEQIDDLVNIDRKETENLDDNQKIQVSELNSRLDRVESAIENPDISESTKTILGFQKEAIEKEIDKILKNVPAVPQPVFDTEESIGEEIRESNRKFQAGEIDQATWEQEQKDLNKRAEDIIPVPEDAEIGKTEEVISEDIETKKAEIDSLQEEIDLLVPEQNRLVEIVNNEDRRVGQPQSENEIKLNEIINKSLSLVDERNAIEEELAVLEQQTKPKEDAIQVETTGQVPVQPEAKVGEEVEQGKPEAKPKVVAEEGKEVVGKPINVYHGGSVFSLEDINENEPFFVTESKKEATDYSKGNDGDVIVAKIDSSKIAKEDIARGILTKMGYSDEYMFHELIDPRFEESYIGLNDVNELFSKIKEKGYEGVEFNDSGLYDTRNIKNIVLISPKKTLANSGFENTRIVGETRAYDLLEEGFNPVVDGKILENVTEEELGDLFRNSSTVEMTKNELKAKPEVVTEEGVKTEEINQFVIEPNERTSWSKNGKQYKVGDVIGGNQLDELSGDLVGNAPNERFVLVQEPLSKFDDNRESLLSQEKGYEQEEIDRLESMKANFDQTPPIPQEGDGMHRIVVAKELGNKTILMWKNIKNVTPVLSKEQTPAQQVEQLRADEQAELKTTIPNAEQYLTDGKVDRAKITDAKDLKKFDEIYDKYDKLITPLLPKKETSAPKQEAPAKAKALPKPKVATRLAFKKAVDLFYDISAADGSAKKGTLSRKRQRFLEQNPTIKYIDDNWNAISKQLEDKGLLTKSKGCP